MLLLLLHPAFADVSDGDRWLESARIAVGVNADGSLINDGLDLGLLWDPPGEAPMGSDLLTAGNEFEAWSVEYTAGSGSQALVNEAPYGGSDLVFTWDLDLEGADAEVLHGAVSGDALGVETWIALSRTEDVIWLTLAFTAWEPVTDLAVARALDLDPDAAFSGEYSTDNTTGEGYAAAVGLWDGRALAMATPGGIGGICAWCALPSEILAGDAGPTEGDDQIGLTVTLGDLAAGETARVTYAYALGADVDAAVALALASAANPTWEDNGAIDSAFSDDDGDSFAEADGDCDDANAAVFPGASAVAGVADADCDGARDDGSWDTAADTAGEPEIKPGGCTTLPGPARGGPALAILALALGLRRRR